MRRVVIIGGGIGGLSAARALARAGRQVVLVERAPRLGGLVVDFELSGTPLERFYHYVFPHERDIQRLLSELGLLERLEWYQSTVGMLIGGRIWPFTSPLDLLRFAPLSPLDRVRTAVGALRLARVRDWVPLDALTAEDWLEDLTGAQARRVVWEPLLRAKFGPAAGTVPAAWMWGRLQQRRGARRRGGERLGYLRGGFGALFEALGEELARLGTDIRTGAAAERITVSHGRASGVVVDGEHIDAEAVLFSGALPNLPALLPADVSDERWTATGALGVVCVIVELRRPLTQVFWTNVCDADVPFGGIIEHTNLVPAAHYGGRHVVYLSRYFTQGEAIAGADLQGIAESWMDLVRHQFAIPEADVLSVQPFRTPYAAPLVSTGHLTRIPSLSSSVRGLYVSTTAQIYPQDRGMSEGVRTGQAAARRILSDLGVHQAV